MTRKNKIIFILKMAGIITPQIILLAIFVYSQILLWKEVLNK
jgi:hypothetical protein